MKNVGNSFRVGFGFVLAGCLTFYSFNATSSQDGSLSIVPSHEHKLAQTQHLKGPTKTIGIGSVNLLGVIGLEKDFPTLKGRQLRARELLIEPGGVVAVHQHDTRPGVAYILEGEIIEHRNDSNAPIVRGIGSVAFEQSGVAHWWENKSGKPVRALVVDIIKVK